MSPSNLANFQVFPKRFFSGSDVYVFFNNILVDQILDLEYVLEESVIPIYGYASYTYDAIAVGSRIVTGKFKVQFTESMYLYSILNGVSSTRDEKTFSEDTRSAVEYIGGDLTADYISSIVKNGSGDKLLDVIRANENKLWGSENIAPQINRYQQRAFSGSASPSIKENGFDIVISYGDRKFHIGEDLDKIPSTVNTINGVHLTGVRKVIQPIGQAIYEEYSFVARDLDNSLNAKK